MFEYLDCGTDIPRSRDARDRLLEFYSDDREQCYAISRDGSRVTVPILTRPGWLRPIPSVNDVLTAFEPNFESQVDERFIDEYRESLAALRDRDGRSLDELLWNGELFRLAFVDPDRPEFFFELTDYYSCLSDCSSLAVELYDEVARSRCDRSAESTLDVRASRAPDFRRILQSENRYYKVGVNVLTVFANRDGGHEALFAKRSSDVVEHPGTYHVVPAGTFEPHGDADSEAEGFDLRSHIVREFVEELFSASYDPALPAAAQPEIVRSVFDLFDEGTAELWYTGFGFELLRTQPEVTALLYVSDPDRASELKELLNPNWEVTATADPADVVFDVSSDRLHDVVRSSRTVPSAGLALYQGLETLETAYGIDTGADFAVRTPGDT